MASFPTVEQIVARAPSEWVVVVSYEPDDVPFAECKGETVSEWLGVVFPSTPARDNPYALPGLRRRVVPPIATEPVEGGLMLYCPQNAELSKFNERASALADRPVHGTAVVLCATEADAALVVSSVDRIPVGAGLLEKLGAVAIAKLGRLWTRGR